MISSSSDGSYKASLRNSLGEIKLPNIEVLGFSEHFDLDTLKVMSPKILSSRFQLTKHEGRQVLVYTEGLKAGGCMGSKTKTHREVVIPKQIVPAERSLNQKLIDTKLLKDLAPFTIEGNPSKYSQEMCPISIDAIDENLIEDTLEETAQSLRDLSSPASFAERTNKQVWEGNVQKLSPEAKYMIRIVSMVHSDNIPNDMVFEIFSAKYNRSK